MIKRLGSLFLCVAVIAAQLVTVTAEEIQFKPPDEQTNEYFTNRFIATTNKETSMFSLTDSDNFAAEDIKSAINDILSDTDNTLSDTNVTDILLFEDDSSVITLSDNVRSNEFIETIKDTLGDTISLQPDYPVYMDTEQTTGDESVYASNSTYSREWEENLANAQELYTGNTARIAVIGSNFSMSPGCTYESFVDAYEIVQNNNTTSTTNNDMSKCLAINRAAPDAKIIPITAFEGYKESTGATPGKIYAYTSNIVKAITYAQNHGAQIMLCDWYTSNCNTYLKEKMQQSNMLFIATANGVDNNYNLDDYPVYPACFDLDNILTVSKVDDNYAITANSCYGSAVDIYAWTSYAQGYAAPSALTAGAAALVLEKNNTSQNLKSILLQAATSVSYLPGTSEFTEYKVLDFYNSLMDNPENNTKEITTPSTGGSYDGNYDVYTGLAPYYTNIKQISAGENTMAVLLSDGTVKMAVYPSTTGVHIIHPFDSLNSNGEFVKIPGLPKIEKIALTPDGKGLLAVSEAGKLYEWGDKESMGLADSGIINTPAEDKNISDVESVFTANKTTWIQKADKTVYSVGSNICRDGNQYEFLQVTEAQGATDIQLSSDKAIVLKDNSAYIKATSTTASSPNKLTGFGSTDGAQIKDVAIFDNMYLALDVNNTVWVLTTSPNAVPVIYQSNVTEITNDNTMAFFKNANSENTYTFRARLTTTTSINSDNTLIDENKIQSICCNKYSTNIPSVKNYSGYYVLTDDGTLYYAPSPGMNVPVGYTPEFTAIAKNHLTGNIHSIEPVTLHLEHDQAYTKDDIAELLEPYNRVTAMLDDGTEISLPVTWSISSPYQDTLGVQTLQGTILGGSDPESSKNPNNVAATATIIKKVPISEVTNIDLKDVAYDTPLSTIEAQLPQKATATLANGTAKEFDVEWDTSKYSPTTSGKQEMYGTLNIDDDTVSNPYNRRAKATVVVGKSLDYYIESIDSISMNAREGLLLDIGDKPMVGTEVPTLEEVPSTVTAHTMNNKTLTLNVTWDDKDYDPYNTVHAQKLTGTVEIPEGYELAPNAGPVLYVTVLPESYEVMELYLETPSVTVLGGSSIAEINEKLTKTVGINAEAQSDGSEVFFFDSFEVTSEDNPGFDPDLLGHQTLTGRFEHDAISSEAYGITIDIDVNIISSPISIVSTAEVDAYQSVSIENNDNVPNTVKVTLENGMELSAGVKWDFENYHKDAAGDQIITGKLINLPSGAIQTTPERVATLIIHVTPVNYKIKSIVDNLDETVDACIAIDNLKDNLSFETVTVELESVTPDISITAEYDMPYTINAEDNADYDPYYPDFYLIEGQFTLPANISNTDNIPFQINLTTLGLEIASIEPCVANTTKGTAFADVQKPETANVTLSNGSVEEIEVNWNSDEGYISDSPELTVDNPIQCTVNGILTNIPAYIDYYNQPVPLNITVTQPREFYISSIAPSRIPETGSITLNLGSTLEDIYKEIESHTVTLNLRDASGASVPSQQAAFTIRTEDNTDYSAVIVGEQTVTAYLDLPENIKNPDGVQLEISVNLVKRIVKSATVVKLPNVPYGTAFADIGLPENAPVVFTDGTSGALPATWNESTYQPEKTNGAHIVRGTYNTPLPIYAENPNNRRPSAAVTIVKENTTILSAEPIESKPSRMMRLAPENTILSDSIEYDDIPGLRIRNYKITVLNADGSITDEIMSVFETVE